MAKSPALVGGRRPGSSAVIDRGAAVLQGVGLCKAAVICQWIEQRIDRTCAGADLVAVDPVGEIRSVAGCTDQVVAQRRVAAAQQVLGAGIAGALADTAGRRLGVAIDRAVTVVVEIVAGLGDRSVERITGVAAPGNRSTRRNRVPARGWPRRTGGPFARVLRSS